jgi:hypothetical protein
VIKAIVIAVLIGATAAAAQRPSRPSLWEILRYLRNACRPVARFLRRRPSSLPATQFAEGFGQAFEYRRTRGPVLRHQ